VSARTATYDVRVDYDYATFGAFEIVQVSASSPGEASCAALELCPLALSVTVLCARFAPDATYLGGIAMVAS
jgi:hypothetical protein